MLLIERLKQELKNREHVDQTADMFRQMSLSVEQKRRAGGNGNEEQGIEDSVLKTIINTGDGDKMVLIYR